MLSILRASPLECAAPKCSLSSPLRRFVLATLTNADGCRLSALAGDMRTKRRDRDQGCFQIGGQSLSDPVVRHAPAGAYGIARIARPFRSNRCALHSIAQAGLQS